MPSSSKRRGVVEKKLESKPSLKSTVSMPGVFLVDEANVKSKAAEDFEASEYDSMSNNGSCSGESSEDQALKEKAPIPGLEAPLDKQEKIRLKNEKKHQRQRERRAKELKERCEGYLMSNKLERLAQQLVAMGFPSDKATMALILNDGHVEQSISFLLEDGIGPNDVKKAAASRVKIDISEELKTLADIETKYKFNRQDIERAVVACEGDIDKACKWLQEHQPPPGPAEPVFKQETSSSARLPAVSVSTQRRGELLQQHPGIWVQPQHAMPMVPPRPVAAPRTGPWQRASPAQGMAPITAAAAMSAGRPDLAHHRTLPELGPQRLFPPDPRSYHYHPVEAAVAKRLEDMLLLNADHFTPPGLQQQQAAFRGHVQPPAAALQQQQAMWGSQHIGTGGAGFDDWNAKAFRSVDYRAIDWSMGPSRPPTTSSHGGAAAGAWEHQRSFQHQQVVDAVGYNELPELSDSLSPEWTTPFAGKELFQHQAVHSL